MLRSNFILNIKKNNFALVIDAKWIIINKGFYKLMIFIHEI